MMTRMKPHSRVRSAGLTTHDPCLPGSFGQFATPQPQSARFVRPRGYAMQRAGLRLLGPSLFIRRWAAFLLALARLKSGSFGQVVEHRLCRVAS
jgi:hypothetical protein